MKRLVVAALFASALQIAGWGPASAQSQYLSEVRLFASNFCPTGWLPADGRLLPITQNTALFALIGTTYGGNGRDNFALPNLGGRVPVGQSTATSPLFSLGEQESGSLPKGSAPNSQQLGLLGVNWCIASQGIFPSRQ